MAVAAGSRAVESAARGDELAVGSWLLAKYRAVEPDSDTTVAVGVGVAGAATRAGNPGRGSAVGVPT